MDSSGSTSGGLLGGIDPSLLLSLGAGLLSQRGPGANVGSGLLGGMQAYQANRAANQQYQANQTAQQLQQIQLQRARMGQQILAGAFGGGQPGAQPPAAPPTPPPGIAAPGPSAGSTAAQQIMGGGWMPQQGQPQQPKGLQRPDITPLLAPTDPRLGMVDPEIYKAQEAGRTARIQQIYTTQVVPHAQNFADVATGARPLSSLPAEEQQLFRDTAGQMGVDLSTVNGQRMVASALHNNWTQQFGNPPVPPKLEVQTDRYGNQYDPITHANVHEEAPEKVMGANGKGVNVPKDQSYGREPWSQFAVGGNVGQPAMEAWYQQYLASGKIPTGIPPGAKNAALSYITQRAGQDGVDATGLQVGATTRAQAAKATGGQVGKLAVASNELGPFSDQVLAASQEVPRGSWRTGTRISQWVGSQFNDPALLNFKAKMQTLENTYEQLAARSGMDAGKRAHIMDLFDTATSPAGVQRLTQALKEEAAGAKTGVQGAVGEISNLGRPTPGAPPPLPPRPGTQPPPVPQTASQPQAQPLPARPGAVTRSGKWTIERMN